MDQLAHAFLFSGPRGVGKTTCARILAKAINCTDLGEDGEPCNACSSCQTFNEGRSLNIHELDAASNNSVDDIRKIIEQVRYVPTSGKKSVFIIDEVHMLSSAAFNAFLKTLEEPPAHAVFILATTEKHKILPTILSRVQKFDFRRIKVNSVAEHLQHICEKEEIQFEFEALQLIGLKADGALRDALSIFDQIVSYSHRNITYGIVLENLQVLDYDYFFKVVDLMMEQNHEDMLVLLHEVIENGFEAKKFLTGLVEHFRNLLISKTPKTMGLLETSDNVKKRYMEQIKAVEPTLLLNAFNLSSQSEQGLKNATNPRLAIELCLIKLAHLKSAITLAVTEKKKLAESRSEKVAPSPSIEAEVKPEETPDVEEPIVIKRFETKVSRLKKPLSSMKGGFSIPKSLADIDLNAKRPGQEEEEEETEEFIKYDPNFVIDPVLFEKKLDALIVILENQRAYVTLSALAKTAYALKGNKWLQRVSTDLAKKQLFEEKQVLAYMRKELKIPNLMLEIEVAELKTPEGDRLLYTNEEKLKAMKEKNPDLDSFLRTFNAQMKY
ncbi:UNVERIFIED_CONTAM: hypothetical protein GTU68_029136 [Idotea baltica]|nr:hypothetical protein [Idotea baltica]